MNDYKFILSAPRRPKQTSGGGQLESEPGSSERHRLEPSRILLFEFGGSILAFGSNNSIARAAGRLRRWGRFYGAASLAAWRAASPAGL